MPKILPRKTRISETPCFFATLSQRNAKNPTQKDTNFGNAIILHYMKPENHQIQPRKTRILHKTALIDPSKNAKESIHFSRILHIILNALINPILTNQTTTWEHLVACFLNCRPIVTHSDSSILAQDAVLNCYKKPAHYYYHFSDFSEDQLHLVYYFSANTLWMLMDFTFMD